MFVCFRVCVCVFLCLFPVFLCVCFLCVFHTKNPYVNVRRRGTGSHKSQLALFRQSFLLDLSRSVRPQPGWRGGGRGEGSKTLDRLQEELTLPTLLFGDVLLASCARDTKSIPLQHIWERLEVSVEGWVGK